MSPAAGFPGHAPGGGGQAPALPERRTDATAMRKAPDPFFGNVQGRLPVQRDEVEARHLLVVERPLSSASSAYAVKLALGRCRRGERVTVFLLGTALQGEANPSVVSPIQRLLSSGGRVLAARALMRPSSLLAKTQGVERGTEDDLASLLLAPGIDAAWC